MATPSTLGISKRISTLFALQVLLVFVAVVGCSGRGDRSETAQVSGTVVVDGKPLPAGRIVFQSKVTRMAIGRIEDGNILDVRTYEENDGAPVGLQRVAIKPHVDESLGMNDPVKAAAQMRNSRVPMRFQSTKTSPLTAEIEQGENELKFELTSE